MLKLESRNSQIISVVISVLSLVTNFLLFGLNALGNILSYFKCENLSFSFGYIAVIIIIIFLNDFNIILQINKLIFFKLKFSALRQSDFG